jgi:hypothetical protein
MASGRAPFVAVRTDIRKEERVRFTAEFAGYNEYEAIGRYTSLWCWCTDRGLEDAPDDCEGYAVPDAVVRRFLGQRGVEALLGDGCDELAMGERRPDGLIYLRGTSDTVDRLRSLRTSATAGGRSRSVDARRGSGGRFVASTTLVQLATSDPPAAASEIPDPRSQIPSGDPHPARAIQPTPLPVPTGVPTAPVPPAPCAQASPPPTDREDIARTPPALNPERSATPREQAPDPREQTTADRERESRRRVQLELRAELERVRREVAAELGVTDHGLLAQDPGERDLAMHLVNAGPAGLAAARAQALHAIAMAGLEARHRDGGSLQWLTGAIFGERNFRRLVAMTPADARRERPVAKGGAQPAPAKPRKKPDSRPKDPPAEELAVSAAIAREALSTIWGVTDGARAPPASAGTTTDDGTETHDEHPQPAKAAT